MAHNRDDHTKNFSFMMNESAQWHFAPAYDLTFSSGPSGEQSTTVMGEGKNITSEHLIELAHSAHINKNTVKTVIKKTADALKQWEKIAKHAGVLKINIDQVKQRLKTICVE